MTIQELSNSYEIEYIYGYFVDSIINGQIQQAKKLLKEIRECEDFSDFLLYSIVEGCDEDTKQKAIKIIINQ